VRVVSAVLLSLVWGLVAASSAAAYEDKITLGAGVGYALAPASAAAPHGLAFDAHAGLGLGVEWQLRGALTYAHHPAERAAVHVGLARAELVYLVDIVDFVPFGGLGLGARWIDAGGSSAADFAAHAVLGLAYWLSFDALLELDVRAHVLPDRLSTDAVYLVSALSFVWAFER
jgi:hypothetical protein